MHTGSFDKEMSKCVSLCVSVSVSVCRCLALGGQGADVMSVCVCLMRCLASHAGRWAGAVASEPRGIKGLMCGGGWCPPSPRCLIQLQTLSREKKGPLENYLTICEATTVSVGVSLILCMALTSLSTSACRASMKTCLFARWSRHCCLKKREQVSPPEIKLSP